MEVAKRLVRSGDSVEWFAARFDQAPGIDYIDGVRIVRSGHPWTVHLNAYRHYRNRLVGHFDIVVDEVNTIPFLTPLWADIPRVLLIHQLAREVWWYEAPAPLNAIGFLAEPIYLRCYRGGTAITVSESTKNDLRRLKFVGPIVVVPQGLESITSVESLKAAEPTFIYVGRLAPSKRIGHMLKALAQFRRETGTGTLWLVGDGARSYRQALFDLARDLNVVDSVTFWGRLPTTQKHALMARAHALLMTSVREGWGLAVTEANALGTPAIVYDVPGLRDSVRHDVTGLVVPATSASLLHGMYRLATDPELHSRLALASRHWASTFSFDLTATAVRSTLRAVAGSK